MQSYERNEDNCAWEYTRIEKWWDEMGFMWKTEHGIIALETKRLWGSFGVHEIVEMHVQIAGLPKEEGGKAGFSLSQNFYMTLINQGKKSF